MFFAVYEDRNGKRNYATIPLNEVIERQKQGLLSVPETNEKGNKLEFSLSPNDLVYTSKEYDNIDSINGNKEELDRIYKVVSFTGNRLYVIPINVASVIVNKIEYSQLNKIEFTNEKETLMKLNVDRLGNISKA